MHQTLPLYALHTGDLGMGIRMGIRMGVRMGMGVDAGMDVGVVMASGTLMGSVRVQIQLGQMFASVCTISQSSAIREVTPRLGAGLGL